MIDPLDRNKTILTHKITALASAYLDALGCKPIETEVSMGNGTIADIASFTYPTMSELKRGKLLKHLIDKNVFEDYRQDNLFRYRYGGILTVCVEVKTSLSDLKKDLGRKYDYKKHLILPTHLCYLAVPAFLEEEVNKIYGWGRIICHNNGERIKKVYPQWFPNALHPYQIIDVIAQIAIRREHRTRYRAMRDWLKTYRAKEK